MAVQINVAANQAALVQSIQAGIQAYNQKFASQNQINLGINARSFSQPLGRITGDVKDFEAALAASNARVIAFGASTAVLGGVLRSFKSIAQVTIDVEKNLTDINRVFGLSTQELQKFSSELFNVSKMTASSFKDASQAALEFSRQGVKAEEVIQRTTDALSLARLAGMNVSNAIEALTATVNGFKATGITTTQVLNKLVAVEQSYAVSAGDLAEALSRTGLAAQEAGVNIDELNALVTAAQEKTARGGAVIGNALKTIFTRLQRTETLDQLEDFNIKVRDMQGNILPAVTILKNFASAYRGLADSQKAQLSEQVAGVYQVNILKSIISDLDGAQSAYNGALRKGAEASNEAEMAVAKLNLSLDALLSQTSTVAQQFAANIGKVTFEPLAKYAVGKFKSLFETLNETLEGEGLGSTFANGLLKGIRNVLAGPGAVLAFFTLFKLIQKSFTQLTAAIPQIIGITTETQNRKNLEQAILKIMQSQSDAARILEGHMGNEAAQAKYLLEIARAQTAEYQKQSTLAKSLASQLSYQGATVVGETAGGGLRVTRSDGFVPSVKKEVMGAKSLGANSGVKAVSGIGKIGGKKFIANNQELQIPNFAGSGETAVIPKYGGGMKKAIQMISSGKSGSILSAGYVPNFAAEKPKVDRTATRDEMRSILGGFESVEDALKTYSSPGSPKTAYWKIGDELVSASSAQLKNAFMKSNIQFGGYTTLNLDGGPESTADKSGKTFEKLALNYLQPNTYSAQMNSFPFDLKIPGGPNSSVDFFNPVSGTFFEAKSGGYDTGPVQSKFLRVRSELKDNLDEQLRNWSNVLIVNSHGKNKEELKNTGYIPNFAKRSKTPRIVGKGSNLFVSSLYDALSGEFGGGPEYPFVRPGMGAAFLNKSKITDMVKMIQPYIESGSRVIFGAQAGTVQGDRGLIKGLSGNKMVIEKLKQAYPKLAKKFVQEGTSTNDLTALFKKFYKVLGLKKIREIVTPFIEPDILDFYKKNPEFGASISRLAELGPESLIRAVSSQHSLYPDAIAGKALKRTNPVNAQKLFQSAGGLSKKEVSKIFAIVRVAKLPIGIRWDEGDETSKMLGLSSGFLPNLAPFNIKRGIGLYGDQHLLTLPSGSDMQYKYDKNEKLLNIKYVESREKGEGWKLWARAIKMARRLKSNIASGTILPQERELDELDKETADFYSIIKTAFPQLNYRERGKGKNTSLTMIRRLSQGGVIEKIISGKQILQKVVGASEYMYKGDSASLYDDIINNGFEISDLLDTVNRGFLPNFAKYKIVRTADKGQRRRNRAIAANESGSSLLYSYVSSNRVRGRHMDFNYINSYKTGEGHEMFDRYSKMARRLGVKSYSSMLMPQTKLSDIIPKDEFDSLSEFHQRHKYVLENMSIRDILKMAFPQLVYRERGLTKNSDITYTIERAGLYDEKLKGKNIFSSLVSAVKPYYDERNPIDMIHLRDELLSRDTRVDQIVDEFSQGFLPNFADLNSSLNPKVLSSFSSGKELLKYIQSLKIKGVKKGSSRMFIPLDEKRGLKIAMNKAGIAQNEVEFPILSNDYFAQENYSDILPKGFEYDENNFLWGILEKMRSAKEKDFEKFTGKSSRWFLKPSYPRNKLVNGRKTLHLEKRFSDVEHKIREFLANYNLSEGDFNEGHNVGVGMIDDPQLDFFDMNRKIEGLKLFDIGFNSDIGRTFYGASRPRFGHFNSGFLPNFGKYRIVKNTPRGRAGDKRKEIVSKKGSFLKYSYVPEDEEKGPHFYLDFIHSLERGEGHEMFHRYSKMARRMGVKSYSSTILPQKKMKYLITGEIKKDNVPIEDLSLKDILKMAFPQLMYRERGISKDTGIRYRLSRKQPFTSFNLSGKNIFTQLLDELSKYYGDSVDEKEDFARDIYSGKIGVFDLVDKFAKGYLPNFADGYLNKVMGLESSISGNKPILDTSTGPFPFIRNSSQPNFAAAVADHGGMNKALSDSYNNQIAAGLVNDGFVPNFAKFKFTAMDSTGREKKGPIEAENKEDAIKKLKAMGLNPTKVIPVNEQSKAKRDRNKVETEPSVETKTGSVSAYKLYKNALSGRQLWERIMPTGGFGDPNAPTAIQRPLPPEINLATAGSQLGIKEEVFDKLVKQLQDNIKEATKDIGGFGRIFKKSDVEVTRKAIETFRANLEQELDKPENITNPKKGTSLQRIRAIEEKALLNLQEERKQAKAGRTSQYGTILAIAGPQIAGLLEQAAFGNKPRTELTQKERMGQSLLSTGITAVSTGASLGSFFGLPGTIIGSIAGGLIGLADAATSASLSLEEIAQKSNERLQKLQEVSQAGTGYVESLRNLQELIVSGASQDKIKMASDQVALSFTEIADVKLAAKLSAAGSDVEKLSEELQKYNIEVKKSQGLVNALANLKSSDNAFSLYFMGGQTTAQKGVKSPKTAAANLAQAFFGTKVEQDLFNAFNLKGQAFISTVENLVKEAFPDLVVGAEDFRNEVQRLADLLGGSSSLEIEVALKDLYKLGVDNKLIQNVRKAATESFNTIMRRIEQNILMTALLTERELGQRQSMLSIEKTLVEFRNSFAETMESFIQSNLPEGPLKTAYGKQAASAKYYRQLNQLEVNRLEFQLNQEKDRRSFEQKQTEEFNKEFKDSILKSQSLGKFYEETIFPQIKSGAISFDSTKIIETLGTELTRQVEEIGQKQPILKSILSRGDITTPSGREKMITEAYQSLIPNVPSLSSVTLPTQTNAPAINTSLVSIPAQQFTFQENKDIADFIESLRNFALFTSTFENSTTREILDNRIQILKTDKENNNIALSNAQKEFEIRQALEKENAQLILSTTSLQLEANQKILNNNLFLKRVVEQIGNGLKIANATSEALILKYEGLKEDFRIDYFKGLKEILDRRVGLDADVLKEQRNIEDRNLLQDIQSKALQIAVEQENTKVTKDLTDVMNKFLLMQIENKLTPDELTQIKENPYYGMSQNELNRVIMTPENIDRIKLTESGFLENSPVPQQLEEASKLATDADRLAKINLYKSVLATQAATKATAVSPQMMGSLAVAKAATNPLYSTTDFMTNFQKMQNENAKLSIPEQIQGQKTFLADQLNKAQAAGNTELAVTIKNLMDELDTRKEILNISRKQVDENIKERNSRDYEMITYGGRLKKGFGEMKKQSQEMSLLIAEELPVKFADGMTNALMDVAKGVKSIGDAFTDMIINIGQSIMQESIRALMFRAIGSAGGSISSLFQQGGIVKAQNGGFIRGQNGFVVPGSGTGDKIPALLEPNEYVVNSRAAQIIGHDNLDALNFGMLPRFATGGGIAMQPELALKGDQYDFTGQLLRDTGPKKKISLEDYTAYAFAEDEYFKKVREQAVEDEAKRVQSDYEGKMKQAQLVSSIVGMLGGISLSAGLSGVTLTKSGGGKGVVGKNTMSGRRLSLKTTGQTGGSVTHTGIKGYQLGGLVGYQSGGSIPYGSRISDNMASTYNTNTNILSNNATRRYAMSEGPVNMMQTGGPSTSNTTNNSTNNNATNISINIDKSGRSVFGADTNSYEQQDIQFSKKMARELSQFMNVKFSDEQRYNGKLYKSPYT